MKEARMPDMKQVGEAIEYFDGITLLMEGNMRPEKKRYLQTALSILQHVQKHGLALEEGEIRQILLDNFVIGGLKTAGEVAKAIADKQKKPL